MVRFRKLLETDAQGNRLPYLDEIIGKPKREDSVRLTPCALARSSHRCHRLRRCLKRFKENPERRIQKSLAN